MRILYHNLLTTLSNLRFVFRQAGSVKKFALYPLVYLVQYLLGAVVLSVFVKTFGGAKELGPAVVVCITLPITYFLSRLILLQKNRA
jgi:hypothetical protein